MKIILHYTSYTNDVNSFYLYILHAKVGDHHVVAIIKMFMPFKKKAFRLTVVKETKLDHCARITSLTEGLQHHFIKVI